MRLTGLAPVPRLAGLARIGLLVRHRDAARTEVAALCGLGASAALLTTFADFKLGIPGHHIVFAMFPLALGFALVPRRLAGTLMSGSALATIAGVGLAGARVPGVGVLTGLVLAGPLLDLALRWGGAGPRLYGAFVAVGALANVGALLVRGVAKYAGLGGLGGSRPFATWLPVASWTYVMAGMLAGLLSAATWFHFRRPAPS